MPVMVTACDRPAGNRFSVPLAFDRTGRYIAPDAHRDPDGRRGGTERDVLELHPDGVAFVIRRV